MKLFKGIIVLIGFILSINNQAQSGELECKRKVEKEIENIVQTNGELGVSKLKFIKNGKKLLAGYGDGSLILWDTVSGKTIRRFKGHHHWRILSIEVDPDEKFVFTSDRNELIKWNLNNGLLINRIKQ